jgi:hypothetical protein
VRGVVEGPERQVAAGANGGAGQGQAEEGGRAKDGGTRERADLTDPTVGVSSFDRDRSVENEPEPVVGLALGQDRRAGGRAALDQDLRQAGARLGVDPGAPGTSLT